VCEIVLSRKAFMVIVYRNTTFSVTDKQSVRELKDYCETITDYVYRNEKISEKILVTNKAFT
jgi:hypothetical protein